jgi:hypothetical protein
VAEAVAGRLVLARSDRRVDRGSHAREAADVVGDHRLLEPAQPDTRVLDRPDAADRVAGVPAHVRVRHDVDVRPDGVDDGVDELDVAADPLPSLDRPVRETLLHGREPLRRPRCRLRGERVEVLRRVEPARIGGSEGRMAPPRRSWNGDAELLAEQVPERDVDRADRVEDDAAAADVERGAVHRLPEEADL